MKHRIKLLAIAVLLLIAHSVVLAQSSNLMYGSTRIAQMNSLNPAFFPTNCNIYINTLGLNIDGSIPLSITDIAHDTIMRDPNTGKNQHYNYISVNGLIDQLSENSQINLNINQYLLGFGFRVGPSFITFSTQLRMNNSIGLPMDALSVLTTGNANMDGTTKDIEIASGDLLNMQAYLETSIGYGMKIGNLTIGAHIKPLIGLYSVTTQDTRVDINTKEDMSSMSADIYYHARVALPVDVTLDDSTSVQDLLDNAADNLSNSKKTDFGWGLDLGAKYDWHHFEFSASITDLGYIKWNTVYDLHPRNSEEQEFVFQGININESINGGEVNLDTIFSQYKEQLDDLRDAVVTHGESYRTGLHTKFNLAGFYNFPVAGIKLRAGLLIHGELTPRMAASLDEAKHILRRNVSFIGGVNLFDWMEFSLSNSIISNGYKTNIFNPGLGANFMLGHVAQFYMLMDYGTFHFTQKKNFSLYIGGNLMFGRRSFLQRLTGATSMLQDESNDYLL